MNILIIGNGFDIAHGLPTKYGDFLKFTNQFMEFNNAKAEGTELFLEYKGGVSFFQGISEIFENRKEMFDEIEALLEDNCWITYFNQIQLNKDWVDFEKGISIIVQGFDKLRLNIEKSKMADSPQEELPMYIQKTLNVFGYTSNRTWGEYKLFEMKKRLLKDLNRLTRCLEIYLEEFVEKIEPKVMLPDIEALNINRVLSFNYTHTYERVYHPDICKFVEYDYIHGEVKAGSTIEKCNLILGIDEYLEGEDKNKRNEFIQFKKFYQRIYKKTGCKYVDWIRVHEKLIKENPQIESYENHIYILGHSLDITDGDILSSLITMPHTKTTIFHHNQEALGNQINNLVKILGEDELIAMVHGENARIVFKEQQKVKPVK